MTFTSPTSGRVRLPEKKLTRRKSVGVVLSKFGYTIVEVMIAIAIFTAVLAAIYACWSAASRGSRIGLKAAADAHRERVARRAIEEALTSAVMFVENSRHYAFIADNLGDFSYLSFVSRLPATFPGSGMFGDLSVRRITLQVEQTTNQTFQLVMVQAPLLLATNELQEPYQLVLARDVTDFSLEFWATNAGTGEWTDEWMFTNQYPAMIRYILAYGAKPGVSGSATVATGIVAPPAVAVAEFIQVPRGSGAAGVPNPNAPAGGRNNQPAPGGTRMEGLRPPQ